MEKKNRSNLETPHMWPENHTPCLRTNNSYPNSHAGYCNIGIREGHLDGKAESQTWDMYSIASWLCGGKRKYSSERMGCYAALRSRYVYDSQTSVCHTELLPNVEFLCQPLHHFNLGLPTPRLPSGLVLLYRYLPFWWRAPAVSAFWFWFQSKYPVTYAFCSSRLLLIVHTPCLHFCP
jgi:hypothetical protein